VANVYSANLGLGIIPGSGYAQLGPAPAGTLWVIRDIAMTYGLATANDTGNGPGFTVFLNVPDTEQLWPLWAVAPAYDYPGLTHQWKGRQVVPTGGLIQFSQGSAGYFYSVSGYQLTLP
jgi:hypothetical protein